MSRKIVACCSTRYVAFLPLHAAKTPYSEWSLTLKLVIVGRSSLGLRDQVAGLGCVAGSPILARRPCPTDMTDPLISRDRLLAINEQENINAIVISHPLEVALHLLCCF